MGQKGTHAYIWAPVGSRPPMVRDNRHDSVHLCGAICPARGVGAAIIMPAVNTEAMNEHLLEISAHVALDAHAVLVLDGAGWHQRASRLVVPDTITLLSLPPCAPELNPMENVWNYLRPNKLCAPNKLCPSSGTPTTPSSRRAEAPGNSSSTTQNA